MGDTITSKVQSGESLSLYAAMYGCKVDDLKSANAECFNKNGQLKEGSTLTIPIGQKPSEVPKRETTLEKKLNHFEDKLDELHMKLFDTSLKPEEREQLEQEYINMKNRKKERDEYASFKISEDKKGFDLCIKKDITVAKFRELFPECTRRFLKYAMDTNQRIYVQGEGFTYPPEHVILHKGRTFDVRSSDYENRGFWKELFGNF